METERVIVFKVLKDKVVDWNELELGRIVAYYIGKNSNLMFGIIIRKEENTIWEYSGEAKRTVYLRFINWGHQSNHSGMSHEAFDENTFYHTRLEYE